MTNGQSGTPQAPVAGIGSLAADHYIELLIQCLTRYIFLEDEPPPPVIGFTRLRRLGVRTIKSLLTPLGLQPTRRRSSNLEPARRRRAEGRDWPARAESMVGLARLHNVRDCVVSVLRDEIPGDLMETGVWRGGTCILMRGLLDALGDRGRRVWVADSFQGLPPSDVARYPADAKLDLSGYGQLAVSLAEVKANFARYGLLDERVCFLPGWFRDTLSDAPIGQLAVLRLDGDLYESTMQALEPLYPKLSFGGYLIVDDYGAIRACRTAVDEYREKHGITAPIETIDWSGVYWRKN